MINWFIDLNTELKMTVVSIIMATVSVFIALMSLKVTQKSILEANRPYIVVYFDVVDVGHYKKYLIIKNYGNTGAHITDIKLDRTFDKQPINNFILDCSNRFIAPNQSFKTAIPKDETFSELEASASIKLSIRYNDSLKKYKEEVLLYPLSFSNQLYAQDKSKQSEEEFKNKFINALHSINKAQL